MYVCVCVCVCERERERESVCVYNIYAYYTHNIFFTHTEYTAYIYTNI